MPDCHRQAAWPRRWKSSTSRIVQKAATGSSTMDDVIDETLIRDSATGDSLDHQRNFVLTHCPAWHSRSNVPRGTAPGPAKTGLRPLRAETCHWQLSQAPFTPACRQHRPRLYPGRAPGAVFNVVDLLNKLDAGARAECGGRTANLISRLDVFAISLERMAT